MSEDAEQQLTEALQRVYTHYGNDLQRFFDDVSQQEQRRGKMTRTVEQLPRNAKRPEGDAGSNWAVCRNCGREAHTFKAIRHRKYCPATPVRVFEGEG